MTDVLDRLTAALADRYAIQRELGSGGMATVYLAEDLKHKRKVAVKVLRPELAAVLGAERFVQEITTTANLQHPHILPLFDSGTADGFLYYVMPFVEGETLRDKLAREKQLSVEETIEIAQAVAAALSYAHSHGVIHRDIKPENILLESGQAVVADFGIALAVSTAGGQRLTETGLSLGTPQYMSPEQATGDREIDARSDVYALGCVVYEMLVGDPPHTGSTVQAIIAKVLSEEPSAIRQTRDMVPENVEAAVRQALAKTPADRFSTAAQFAEALANPAFTARRTAATATLGQLEAGPWNRVSVTTTAIAGVLLALLAWSLSRSEPPPPVSRYGLSFPPGQALTDLVEVSFALSPDGSNFVYLGPGSDGGGQQLWVKPRDQYEALPLAGTDGARQPVVSPDGEWVAFSVGLELKKIPIGGGSVITLGDSSDIEYGGVTWLDDGSLVYVGTGHHLRRAFDGGRTPERLWDSPNTNRFAVLPVGLPETRGVLFILCDVECVRVQELWVLDLRSGEVRMLMADVAQAWYVSTGHLLYVRPEGGVFAAPFDIGSLELQGAPVLVLDGVEVHNGIMPDFTISPSGMVAMISGVNLSQAYELVWVDRAGAITQIDPTWTFASGSGEHGWSLSPDDTRLAIRLTTDAGHDIWVKRLDRGPLVRVTFDAASDLRPRWTADGQSLTFISNRSGDYNLYMTRADGTGSAEQITDLDLQVWDGLWSPDGQSLVIRTGGQDGKRDLRVIRSGALQDLVVTPFDAKAAALSPDGQWLAYESGESGRDEVYVRPFPDVDTGRWLVSSDGGVMPVWGNRGTELFYVSAAREMMAVAFDPGPPFSFVEQRVLFSIGPELLMPMFEHYTLFDVTSDDRRFVLARRVGFAEERAPDALVIVENFFEELKAKVGN